MGFFANLFGKPARRTAEDVIRFYMGLGFFGTGDPGSTSQELIARYQEDWGQGGPDPDKPWDDVFLLALDENRVWQGDPECDVCEGNNVYAETLLEWSRISSGRFEPKEIEEAWESDQGPISVSFTLGGRRHTLKPEWDNDWLDLNILTSINALIASSGYHFACASDVNFAIVFMLDAPTREKLKRERRFPFIL